MTELNAWRATFEKCKAAGLVLPEGFGFKTGDGDAWLYLYPLNGGPYVPGDAAIALCEMTAIRWLGYPIIRQPGEAGDTWLVLMLDTSHRGTSLGAALRAACEAKAEPADFTKETY